METKITEKDKGYLIEVYTDKEIALAVYTDNGERIYLPGEGGSDSTYYAEDPTFLSATDEGYAVLQSERPDSIEVIS